MTAVPVRKLAIILHADVVGSTTLVSQDETLAHQRIRDCFERFDRTIANYNGVAREIRGDALVAEFEAVLACHGVYWTVLPSLRRTCSSA